MTSSLPKDPPDLNDVNGFVSAAHTGDKTIVRMYLDEYGAAIVNAKDYSGETALMAASRKTFLDVVDMLLSAGADPDAGDKYGQTALVHAIAIGDEGVVRRLLEGNADPNTKNNDAGPANHTGRTPLMWAAELKHVNIVKLLLEKGADVHAQDNDGWTALMYVASRGHTEVAELLLKAGALVYPERRQGGRPDAEWARENNRQDLLDVLQSGDEKLTAPLLARSKNHTDTLTLLEKWATLQEEQARRAEAEISARVNDQIKQLRRRAGKIKFGPL